MLRRERQKRRRGEKGEIYHAALERVGGQHVKVERSDTTPIHFRRKRASERWPVCWREGKGKER